MAYVLALTSAAQAMSDGQTQQWKDTSPEEYAGRRYVPACGLVPAHILLLLLQSISDAMNGRSEEEKET